MKYTTLNPTLSPSGAPVTGCYIFEEPPSHNEVRITCINFKYIHSINYISIEVNNMSTKLEFLRPINQV